MLTLSAGVLKGSLRNFSVTLAARQNGEFHLNVVLATVLNFQMQAFNSLPVRVLMKISFTPGATVHYARFG